MEFGPLLRQKNNAIKAVLDKEHVTASEARDAIEGCYCVTHYQYVEQHAAEVGAAASESTLIATMERLYRKTFTRLGRDFDHPRADDLRVVLEFLDRDLGWAHIDPALHQHHDEICRAVILRIRA